jgi:hypothetical protein
LKRELMLPIGGARSIAAASVNDHEGFFGEAFDIRCADGGWASSACVAFGVERWLLAVLAAYGPDAANWPAIGSVSREPRTANALASRTDDTAPVPLALGGMARC